MRPHAPSDRIAAEQRVGRRGSAPQDVEPGRLGEKAQAHAVKIPDMLHGITTDPNAGSRARIEASKLQNAIADGPDKTGGQNAGERFTITINLGADTEVYDKELPKRPPVLDLEANPE